MSISSKAMSITGRDDRRYWSDLATDESRYFVFVFVFVFEVKLLVRKLGSHSMKLSAS